MPPTTPKPRDRSRSPAQIACVRCRHRKRKCDHRLPSCGECERSGAECVRFQDRKSRDAQSVPWAYVKGLETRLAQVEKDLRLCLHALRAQGSHDAPSQSETETLAQPQPSPGRSQTTPMLSQDSASLTVGLVDSVAPGINEVVLLRPDLDNYMLHVHPSWPFLDADHLTWLFELSVEQSIDTEHHLLCLLYLVCAVGACYCSISDRPSCPHIARSQALHTEAVQQYLPSAVSHSQSVRTQAYLLLVIYAFHSSTPFNLQDAANDAVREITTLLASFEISSMLDSAYPCDINTLATEAQGDERSLLVFCYTVFEIVATLWSRPSEGLAGSLDHKIVDRSNWLAFGGGSLRADLEHMFGLRRIQSRIRMFWATYKAFPGSEEYRREQTAEIKVQLDQWKTLVPLLSGTFDMSMSYHPLAMLKMYNYCVCCLYQNETFDPAVEEFAELLSAASECSRCFRRIQKHWPGVYSTWGALHEQFEIGIILLACFWETPVTSRTTAFQAPEALQALEDSETTLLQFTNRWKAAGVYLETFRLLLSYTPVAPPMFDEPVIFPVEQHQRMQVLLGQLENQGITVNVLALITRMLQRKPHMPENEVTNPQFVPITTDALGWEDMD